MVLLFPRGLWSRYSWLPRFLLLIAAGCVVVVGITEVIVRSVGVDDLHVYNVHRNVLHFLRADEPCYPSQQKARFVFYRKILKNFDDVLSIVKVRYWLDFGTLLAASRSDHFIPWDYDVDVSVLEKEFMPKFGQIQALMVNRGHIIYRSSGCRLVISVKDVSVPFTFEIFLFASASASDVAMFHQWYGYPRLASTSPGHSSLISRCRLTDSYRYTIPRMYANDLLRVPFEGMQLSVPRKHKEMLGKYRYPYTYGVAIPYKINCYLTEMEFAWMLVVFIVVLLLTVFAGASCCWIIVHLLRRRCRNAMT